MESILSDVLDLVSLCLAVVTIMAAVRVGLGEVKALRHPIARILLLCLLGGVGLWILHFGIHHLVSG